LAATLVSAADAQVPANPATFTDPTGDSGNAPDITRVVVANSANGQISFRIDVTELVVPSDTRVLVAIDSDRNPATGHEGSDYALIADLSDAGFVLVRWSGSEFVETPEATFSAGRDGNSVVFSVNRSELGNTNAFDFWARSLQGPMFAAAHEDTAPDTGTFSYELGPGIVPQLTAKLSHTARAKAGKPFVAVLTVTRSDGVPLDLTLDDLKCSATAGSRRLRIGAADALGSQAGCLWNLSRKSKGQILRTSVTVRLDGASVTKTFAAKIK
jgi:hypothetical protein